jgi:hypothetical protein
LSIPLTASNPTHCSNGIHRLIDFGITIIVYAIALVIVEGCILWSTAINPLTVLTHDSSLTAAGTNATGRYSPHKVFIRDAIAIAVKSVAREV